MKALVKILAGGVGLAALVSAAPAAAQYYPAPGYGSGDVLGQVLGGILGGNQYGANDRMLIDRCAAAVQQRLNAQYSGYNPYGGYGSPYGGYNNYGYGQARILGVSSVNRRTSVLRVRGTATANGNVGYGAYGNPYGGYGAYAQPMGELTFKCDIDYRGFVRDIDINRNTNVGYGYPYYRR